MGEYPMTKEQNNRTQGTVKANNTKANPDNW